MSVVPPSAPSCSLRSRTRRLPAKRFVFANHQRQRTSERVADKRNVASVDVGACAQKRERRASVDGFSVLEQLKLQCVASRFAVFRRRAVHQIDAADAPVGRQANASPEQIHEE